MNSEGLFKGKFVKKKVLVCGATGFIGRNVTERFALNNNYQVYAVRFNRPEYLLPNVTWYQADLREPEEIGPIVNDMDIVIQAAATTSGVKDIVSKPYIHVTDNAVMNSYLFRSAFENKVSHVIFLSCSVMYPSSEKPAKESDYNMNTPLHQRYFGVANTKVYIEKMCEFYSNLSQTKFTAIRHSNIYGPYDKYDLERSHVFGATTSKVLKGKDTISIWGTGEEKRDLLYVDDLIDFIELAINKQPEQYRLYNCGYGIATSVRDLASKIISISGKSLKIKNDLTKPSIKTNLALNCDFANKEIGWYPKTTLNLGIEKTISWCRSVMKLR